LRCFGAPLRSFCDVSGVLCGVSEVLCGPLRCLVLPYPRPSTSMTLLNVNVTSPRNISVTNYPSIALKRLVLPFAPCKLPMALRYGYKMANGEDDAMFCPPTDDPGGMNRYMLTPFTAYYLTLPTFAYICSFQF